MEPLLKWSLIWFNLGFKPYMVYKLTKIHTSVKPNMVWGFYDFMKRNLIWLSSLFGYKAKYDLKM